MKQRLSKKDSGMLDQMLPLIVGIFILSFVFVLMLGTMESIQQKNKVDLVARRAILLLETYGYLEASEEQELLTQLMEANISNPVIRVWGYQNSSQMWGSVDASNPASYGQKVEVEITGVAQTSIGTVNGPGVLTTIFEKQDIPVRVVRVSTSKN